MTKALKELIESLAWKSEEEKKAFIGLLEIRLKEIKEKNAKIRKDTNR